MMEIHDTSGKKSIPCGGGSISGKKTYLCVTKCVTKLLGLRARGLGMMVVMLRLSPPDRKAPSVTEPPPLYIPHCTARDVIRVPPLFECGFVV